MTAEVNADVGAEINANELREELQDVLQDTAAGELQEAQAAATDELQEAETDEPKEKLWNKAFTLSFIDRCFTVIVFGLFTTATATYAMARYDADVSLAGVVSGAYIFGVLVGRLVSNMAFIRFGIKPSCIVAGSISCILLLVFLLDVPLIVSVVLLFFNGLMYGLFTNALIANSTMAIPKSRLGEGLGFFSLTATIGSSIGPFIGLGMLNNHEFTPFFTMLAVVTAIYTLLMIPLPILIDTPTKAEADMDESQRGIYQVIEMAAVPAGVLCLVTSLFYASVNSFLNPMCVDRDLTMAAQLFFVVYSVSLLASRPLAGKLTDRFGARRVLVPTAVLYGLGLILLAVANSTFTIVLAALVLSFGYGGQFPALQALAVQNSLGPRISAASATFYAMSDVGMGIGPMLLGVIAAAAGYAGMYFVSLIATLPAVLIYLLLTRGKTAK